MSTEAQPLTFAEWIKSGGEMRFRDDRLEIVEDELGRAGIKARPHATESYDITSWITPDGFELEPTVIHRTPVWICSDTKASDVKAETAASALSAARRRRNAESLLADSEARCRKAESLLAAIRAIIDDPSYNTPSDWVEIGERINDLPGLR